MYKLVVLACAVASVAAEADPVYAYANGLHYGAAYTNLAGAIPAAYAGAPIAHAAYAAPAYAAPAYTLPATYAAAPIAHATYAAAAPVIAAPAASAYALPPVQTYNEAPIVEQIVEPVEQWGYKVAY